MLEHPRKTITTGIEMITVRILNYNSSHVLLIALNFLSKIINRILIEIESNKIIDKYCNTTFSEEYCLQETIIQ